MKINKLKLWTVVSLAIIVVGFVIFGIFGFNNTADYSSAYEINVSIEENLNNSGEIAYNTATTYLREQGVKYNKTSVQKINEGEIIVFKVLDSSVISDKEKITAIESGLKDKILSAFSEKSIDLDVEVKAFSTVHKLDEKIGYVCLAIGIAIVVVFLYVFFLEKLSASLTVLFNAIISFLLSFSILAITRIPVALYLIPTVITSALLSAILSLVIINRSNELIKNVANNKMSYTEITANATKLSQLRFAFICGATLLLSVLLLIFGGTYYRILGVMFEIASISALFTSYGFTEIIFPFLKSKKKDRKPKTEENE